MKDKYIKIILISIAISLWIIVFQNFDIIKTPKYVYVVNTVDVQGSVDISGSVSIDNTVGVNLEAVLGYPVGCRTSYTIDGRKYNSIDVSVR